MRPGMPERLVTTNWLQMQSGEKQSPQRPVTAQGRFFVQADGVGRRCGIAHPFQARVHIGDHLIHTPGNE